MLYIRFFPPIFIIRTKHSMSARKIVDPFKTAVYPNRNVAFGFGPFFFGPISFYFDMLHEVVIRLQFYLHLHLFRFDFSSFFFAIYLLSLLSDKIEMEPPKWR